MVKQWLTTTNQYMTETKKDTIMVDAQDFLVTRDVAMRTGDISTKYRTKDGRFIIDSRTLSRIQFTSEEMLNGLSGIEKITQEEAETLIAENDYKMGEAEEVEEVSSEEENEVETTVDKEE